MRYRRVADMEKDPDEVENRIHCAEYAEVRDCLHDALLEHMNDTRDVYRGYQWAARPWRADKRLCGKTMPIPANVKTRNTNPAS
ncbi:MAG: hypothetical protein ACLUJ0_13330 [Ruthenibacterium lactatiformans]|uniref:hypothetical protein n=1 Tax=Ruthenibacterium lactatiformans TaxID=1550024 RepID=UPI0039923AE3